MIPAGITAVPSSCSPARYGVGRGEGRTPGWRAKLPAARRLPHRASQSATPQFDFLAPGRQPDEQALEADCCRRAYTRGRRQALGRWRQRGSRREARLLSPETAVVVAIWPSSCVVWACPVVGRSPGVCTPARACHRQATGRAACGRWRLRHRRALRGSRTHSLERLEGALTRHVHSGVVTEIGQDLDQALSVLIGAGAWRARRLEVFVVR